MYADMTGVSQHKVARVVTPVLKSGRYCLEFFYRSINNFNGLFRVFTSSKRASQNLYFRNGMVIKNQWTIVELWLKKSTDFAVTSLAFSLFNDDADNDETIEFVWDLQGILLLQEYLFLFSVSANMFKSLPQMFVVFVNLLHRM